MQFDDAVLVERGSSGRELECAVLGYERIEASAVGEIVPGNEFYDYADKYLLDNAGLIAPAELTSYLARTASRTGSSDAAHWLVDTMAWPAGGMRPPIASTR